MNKISIILPVWNNVGYVGKCIQCLKDQTLKNIECIVVNDGSIDGSDCEAYKAIDSDQRFKLIHQEHSGLSCARNHGIDESTGDIILHVDCDDIPLPQMAERVSWCFENYDPEMVVFDADIKPDGTSDILYSMEKRHFHRKEHYGIDSGKEMLKRMLHNKDYVYATFIHALKRNANRRRFYPGLRTQDWLHTTQNLLLAKKVVHLPEILYIKTSRSGSIMHKRHDAHFVWSRLKSLIEFSRFIEEENLEDALDFLEPSFFEEVHKSIATFVNNFREQDFDWMKTLSLEDRQLLLLLHYFVKKNKKVVSTVPKTFK